MAGGAIAHRVGAEIAVSSEGTPLRQIDTEGAESFRLGERADVVGP